MTIDIDDPEFLGCPFPALAKARTGVGVQPAGRAGWFLVTTAELVREVLRDTATYSSAVHKHASPPPEVAQQVSALRARGWPYTPGLGTTDPPVHTRHRKLVNQTFTPRGLAWMEPLVRQAGEATWPTALPDEAEIDFVTAFAQPLPVWAISEILGLPEPPDGPTSRSGPGPPPPASGPVLSPQDWLAVPRCCWSCSSRCPRLWRRSAGTHRAPDRPLWRPPPSRTARR